MNKKTKNSYEENFWEPSYKTEPIIENKEEVKVEAEPKVKPVEKPIEKKAFSEYQVQINYSTLKVRKGPGSNYDAIGFVKNLERYTILAEENGFGKIDEGKWIMLSYCIKV